MRSFIVWPLWNGAVTRWMVEEHIDGGGFIPVDSFLSEQEAMAWIKDACLTTARDPNKLEATH